MGTKHQGRFRISAIGLRQQRALLIFAALLSPVALTGCAAFSNPVANGLPVHRLPPELRGESRGDRKTIPLSYLRQRPPVSYKLGPGDVLAIWIEGVLGERTQIPPTHYTELGNLPPATGFPTPVLENGTLNLPLVEPIQVQNLTIEEAQAKVVDAGLPEVLAQRLVVGR